LFLPLRAKYRHVCVDVCPYIRKANGHPVKRNF